MALLPIASDRVQLTTAAVAADDAFQNGLRVTAGGLTRAVVAAPSAVQSGFGFDSSSRLCYIDATAGLPAGATFTNGLPFTADGRLCVSTDAAVSYANGIPLAANGAVSVTVTP